MSSGKKFLVDVVKPSPKDEVKPTPKRFAILTKADVDKKMYSGRSGTKSHGAWLWGKETTGRSTVAYWAHEPGHFAPERGWKWHDEEEVEMIISGKARLQIGDDKGNVESDVVLGPGEWWYIAPGVRHKFQVLPPGICKGVLFIPTAYDLAKGGQPQIYDRPDWRGEG